MKKILLLHGPNLNWLGKREASLYGGLTLKELEQFTQAEAHKVGLALQCYQSNHEGRLIDKIQAASPSCHGLICNFGALSHSSYALHDALIDCQLPAVEVHLSQIKEREVWRRHSVTAPACLQLISGKKEKGYTEAISLLAEHLK